MSDSDDGKPLEVSAKRRPKRKPILETKKVERRDPRFDELCGDLNVDLFRKSYNFIEEKKQEELNQLTEAYKNARDPEEIEKLKRATTLLKSQIRQHQAEEKQRALKAAHNKANRERVKDGKKPQYLRHGQLKKAALVEKYNNLQSTAKLELAMAKRRKKLSSKDKKFMPSSRRAVEAPGGEDDS